MRLLIGLLLGLLAGIAITFLVVFVILSAPPLPANAYGRFIGTLDPTWLDDGRKMKLNHDFAFVDPNSKAWVAPAGAVVDGASIPQVFWSAIGGPFEGQYRNASVVHDVACQDKTQPSEDVHRMFYFACRCGGVEEAKAKAMYFAVLHGGPRWMLVQEMKILDGQPVGVSKAVDVVKGRELTVEDARAVIKYMETSNPGLPEVASLQIVNGEVNVAAPP